MFDLLYFFIVDCIFICLFDQMFVVQNMDLYLYIVLVIFSFGFRRLFGLLDIFGLKEK